MCLRVIDQRLQNRPSSLHQWPVKAPARTVPESPLSSGKSIDHARAKSALSFWGFSTRGLSLIALIGLFILIACKSAREPNSANFSNAISQYLVKHGEVCTSIGRQFPIDIPMSIPQAQYGLGLQLTALQQAGVVYETDTKAVVHGMLDALRGTGPPQLVRRYQLTSEGQRYFRQVPGTFEQTGGFCYGQKAVDSIVKWSEPMRVDGRSQSEVTYTYKIVNLAPWAERPEIQRVFPDVGATIIGVSKANQVITLQLSNEGWGVSGR